jgi:hypothetical protein
MDGQFSDCVPSPPMAFKGRSTCSELASCRKLSPRIQSRCIVYSCNNLEYCSGWSYKAVASAVSLRGRRTKFMILGEPGDGLPEKVDTVWGMIVLSVFWDLRPRDEADPGLLSARTSYPTKARFTARSSSRGRAFLLPGFAAPQWSSRATCRWLSLDLDRNGQTSCEAPLSERRSVARRLGLASFLLSGPTVSDVDALQAGFVVPDVQSCSTGD